MKYKYLGDEYLDEYDSGEITNKLSLSVFISLNLIFITIVWMGIKGEVLW